jgi:hypothetical protein
VVPKTIIKPSDFSILPNPSFIKEITPFNGNPIPKPTSKQAKNKAKKAGTLYLVVNTTMRAMPATKKARMYGKELII